jgi:hypothetical protein
MFGVWSEFGLDVLLEPLKFGGRCEWRQSKSRGEGAVIWKRSCCVSLEGRSSVYVYIRAVLRSY